MNLPRKYNVEDYTVLEATSICSILRREIGVIESQLGAVDDCQ